MVWVSDPCAPVNRGCLGTSGCEEIAAGPEELGWISQLAREYLSERLFNMNDSCELLFFLFLRGGAQQSTWDAYLIHFDVQILHDFT